MSADWRAMERELDERYPPRSRVSRSTSIELVDFYRAQYERTPRWRLMRRRFLRNTLIAIAAALEAAEPIAPPRPSTPAYEPLELEE